MIKNQNAKKGNKMNPDNLKSVFPKVALDELLLSVITSNFLDFLIKNYTKDLLGVGSFEQSYTIKSKRKNKKVKFRKSFNKKYILKKEIK